MTQRTRRRARMLGYQAMCRVEFVEWFGLGMWVVLHLRMNFARPRCRYTRVSALEQRDRPLRVVLRRSRRSQFGQKPSYQTAHRDCSIAATRRLDPNMCRLGRVPMAGKAWGQFVGRYTPNLVKPHCSKNARQFPSAGRNPSAPK